MRRRSSADASSEPDPTHDHSPAPLPEHEDKLDYHAAGLIVNAQGWVNQGTPKHEVAASVQRLATGPLAKYHSSTTAPPPPPPPPMAAQHNKKWRQRLRSPWASSPCTVLTTLTAFIAMFLMAQSFLTRQLDVKGCGMSYMRPTYSRFANFDTEHTRFASKYSLYLYREGSLDEDTRARASL
jgi:hypothetical protein